MIDIAVNFFLLPVWHVKCLLLVESNPGGVWTMKDTTGSSDSTEANGAADLHTEGGRRGPTWRGWVLSILVAIVLSVTATLLLGGSGAFRSENAAGMAAGAGTDCCPHMGAGK
jgi:hypothetical protein